MCSAPKHRAWIVAISCMALASCGGDVAGRPGIAPSVVTAEAGVVRFVAIGDTGKGNVGQREVAEAIGEVCAARGCDLLVLLGDNLYPRGMRTPDDPRMDEVLTDVYGALGLPVYPILGNHDWGHGKDEAAALRQVAWAERHPFVRMRGRYYTFEAGPASFVALDTAPLFYERDPEQVAWLDDALEAATARWRVVLGHHPYKSQGKHGNAGSYEGVGWLPIVRGEPLERVFEQQLCGRADLYLSGHDHLLQWLSVCGMELVVSGAGATHRELVDRGNEVRFAAAALGLTWIELGDELTVAFYDANGTLLYEAVAPRR